MPSSCDCCGEDDCPHVNWITLDRWRGSKTIPNNLRDLQVNEESIWGILDLDKYKDSNWQWRVVVFGTGNIPDLTKLCLQQNRREVREWISPLSEQLSTVFFKLELGNIRWPDAPLAVHGDLVGGDFTLTLKAFSWSETTTVLAWDATAQDIQDALQALPNAARAGTIEVTGVPLAFDEHMTVTCIAPLDFMSLTATTNFVGIPPTIIALTTQGGGPTTNETQMLAPSWPADGGTYTISLTAQGNTQTTNAIQHNAPANTVRLYLISRINCDDPPSGNAMVVDEFIDLHWRRHYITFINALALNNIAPLTATSSLTNAPTLIITTPTNSDVYEFRNEYEPLNVGTLWNGFLRKGYGNADNRGLNEIRIEHTENPGEVFGTTEVTALPCGFGTLLVNNCADDLGLRQHGVSHIGEISSRVEANFNSLNGTVSITSARGYEFAIQIRCLGCHYSSEFNLWGVHEDSLLLGYHYYDRNQSILVNPAGGKSCNEPRLCRDWSHRFDNVPSLRRIKFSPDGYDGHLINDVFFADGAMKAHKPTCSPDVVMLGDGYWLEQVFTPQYKNVYCVNGEFFTRCYPLPRKEFQVEHPTASIERLKEIYGTQFSYWGGWIDPESISLPKIRCTFEKYDLTDVKVLFLGGLPVGMVPQLGPLVAPIIGWPIQDGDKFYSGTSWWRTIDKDFEENTLHLLMEWLDLGGRTLVLDGGAFPNKLLTALGLATTVETPVVYGEYPGQTFPTPTANTLNGSLNYSPIWGAQIPFLPLDGPSNLSFKSLYVEPQFHPFTSTVDKGNGPDGDPLLIPDFTFEGSNIAGEPIFYIGETYVIDAEFDGVGAPQRLNRGLINISQKFRYAGGPVGGLRSYTTCIPLVVPGPNAIVLGRVIGQIAVDPWSAGSAYVTADVDYPGIVVEHWKNSSFRLSFTHNDTTEITPLLQFNADAVTIQAALEALANITSGLSVIGGPLPSSVDITFSSPLTTLQNVAQLEILDSLSIKIKTITKGSSIIDEVQRLSLGMGPSRVVISQINELMEPARWGNNWGSVGQVSDSASRPISQDTGGFISEFLLDNQIRAVSKTISVSSPTGCTSVPIRSYSKVGYHWGLGLSNIASAKFLLNLLEHRNDY